MYIFIIFISQIFSLGEKERGLPFMVEACGSELQGFALGEQQSPPSGTPRIAALPLYQGRTNWPVGPCS